MMVPGTCPPVPFVIRNQNLNDNSIVSFPAFRCGVNYREGQGQSTKEDKSLQVLDSLPNLLPFPEQLIWFSDLEAVIYLQMYFTKLLFLSDIFAIVCYTHINAFEFRSQEFGVFALQPHQITCPRQMTTPYLKIHHGMSTGGKNKLIFRIIPLTSEQCSGLMWLLKEILSSIHTSANNSLYIALKRVLASHMLF